ERAAGRGDKRPEKGFGVPRQRCLATVVEHLDLGTCAARGEVAQLPREVRRDDQRGAHLPGNEGPLERLARRKAPRIEGPVGGEVGDETATGGAAPPARRPAAQ